LVTLSLHKRGFDTRRFFALEEYCNVDRRSYCEALATADESNDLTERLEYFVQDLAVEMVRLGKRIPRLERIVNQSAYSNQWVSLGTYRFQGNRNDCVSLADVTYEPYLSRLIAFDAAKWVSR
jgi:hypothetical protein